MTRDKAEAKEVIQDCLRKLEEAGFTGTIILVSRDAEDGGLSMSLGLNGPTHTISLLLFDGAATIITALRDKDPLGFSEIEEAAMEVVAQDLGLASRDEGSGGHC